MSAVRELWLKLDAMVNTADYEYTQDMLPCYACAGKRHTTILSILDHGLVSICGTCWGNANRNYPYDDTFIQEYPQLLAEAQEHAMCQITRAALSNTISESSLKYTGVCDCCLDFDNHTCIIGSLHMCDQCVSGATTRANTAIMTLLILGEITFTPIPDINKFIRLMFMHVV